MKSVMRPSQESEESFPESEEGLLTNQRSPCRDCQSRRRKQHYSIIFPWILCITLTVGLALNAFRKFDRKTSEPWDTTEFEGAKNEISLNLQQIRFTAGLQFDENHKVYRTSGTPEYVGEPTDEMDAAWFDLVGGVNIFVTPEEYAQLPKGGSDLYFDSQTGLYMAEMTAMHDIHCLNLIRQSYHLDRYADRNVSSLKAHIEHCIDALRESIMCHADMTLIPMPFNENRGAMSPDFETVHTCRNYGALKEWSQSRDATDPKRWPENARRLNPDGPVKDLDYDPLKLKFDGNGKMIDDGKGHIRDEDGNWIDDPSWTGIKSELPKSMNGD